MTFLTNLRVTRRLCNLKLVIEGKTGKQIPESSGLDFSANDFALSDAAKKTSDPLSRGCTADLPLLEALLAICTKNTKSHVNPKCKFGSCKSHSTLITSLSECQYRCRRFILLVCICICINVYIIL